MVSFARCIRNKEDDSFGEMIEHMKAQRLVTVRSSSLGVGFNTRSHKMFRRGPDTSQCTHTVTNRTFKESHTRNKQLLHTKRHCSSPQRSGQWCRPLRIHANATPLPSSPHWLRRAGSFHSPSPHSEVARAVMTTWSVVLRSWHHALFICLPHEI